MSDVSQTAPASDADQESTATAETRERSEFVGTMPRSEIVPLEHPLRYKGYLYEEIEVRRMTVQSLAEFVSAESPEDARFPMYFRRDGEPVPNEILSSLDLDDDDKLLEVSKRFLPRRFRGE